MHFSGYLGNGILFGGDGGALSGDRRELILYTRVDRHLEPTVRAVIPGKFEASYNMRTNTLGRAFIRGRASILGGSTLMLPRVEEGALVLETFRIDPGFYVAGAHTGLTWGDSLGEANQRTRAYVP